MVVYKSGMLINLEGNSVTCGYVCYALFSLLMLAAVLAGVFFENIIPYSWYMPSNSISQSDDY